MSWNRVKTIMILLLVVVNVFLAYNLYVQYSAKYFLDDKMLDDTAELLGNSGIKINADIIPKAIITPELYEGSFGEDYYEFVVSTITGAGTDNFTWHMINSGRKCTVKDSGDVFEFYDSDNFSIKYIKSGNTVADTDKSDSDNVDAGVSRTGRLERQLLAFLFPSAATDTVKYGLSVENASYDSALERYYVNCSQLIDGYSVGELGIYAVIHNDEVIYLEGSLAYINGMRKYSASLYDQVNILIMEKDYLEKLAAQESVTPDVEITGMKSEYCVNWNSDRSKFYLIPAWRMTYADNIVRIRNAVNGSEYTTS